VNNKIFNHLRDSLQSRFIGNDPVTAPDITAWTDIASLPWTTDGVENWRRDISNTFGMPVTVRGTVADLCIAIDRAYQARFFSEMYQPKMTVQVHSGHALVETVMRYKPSKILDIGCGSNQYKELMPVPVIGVDPYNPKADHMVDIRDYKDDDTYDAMLSLGSIQYNGYEDVLLTLEASVRFLAPGGRWYFRANQGLQNSSAPWIEFFHWSEYYVQDFAKRLNLKVEQIANETNSRLFFVYHKSE
jgi:hypothetical protein